MVGFDRSVAAAGSGHCMAAGAPVLNSVSVTGGAADTVLMLTDSAPVSAAASFCVAAVAVVSAVDESLGWSVSCSVVESVSAVV